MAQKGVKPLSERDDLVLYWVWLLGRPNPQNLNRRPKYCLGRLYMSRKYNLEHAVLTARKKWPQHQGHMLVEQQIEYD
jgi:hypothetical protein